MESDSVLLLAAVNAHDPLTIVDLVLQQADHAHQLPAALLEVVAVELDLVAAVFVVLLGQLEHLLQLVHVGLQLQSPRPQLRLAQLVLEVVGESAGLLNRCVGTLVSSLRSCSYCEMAERVASMVVSLSLVDLEEETDLESCGSLVELRG